MRALPLGALVAITALAGCGGDRARSFAVTVLEAHALVCVSAGSSYDADALASLASARELSYAEVISQHPPERVGRTLAVVEQEGVVHAWFEGVDAPGFLGPDEVYSGPARDEYIEGTYDRRGPVMGTSQPVLLARGQLTITADADGVLGRVLRTETDYDVGGPDDAADTHLECSRSLTIEGAER